MKQRLITGLIGGGVIAVILIAEKTVLSVVVALVAIFALFELYNALGLSKNVPLALCGILCAFSFMFGWIIDKAMIMPLVFLYMFLLFGIMILYHKSVSFKEISVMFFLSAYVLFSMSHIVHIRQMELGYILVFLVFIGSFATDTCAYFAGTFLGKRKLCVEISPKKTVEGAIGGILGCILFMVLYAVFIKNVLHYNINIWGFIILALLASVFSEIGDLAASVIKRQYKVKDFGNILPGHGGVMDRLDSILFVAPLVYYFLYYFPIVF